MYQIKCLNCGVAKRATASQKRDINKKDIIHCTECQSEQVIVLSV